MRLSTEPFGHTAPVASLWKDHSISSRGSKEGGYSAGFGIVHPAASGTLGAVARGHDPCDVYTGTLIQATGRARPKGPFVHTPPGRKTRSDHDPRNEQGR